MEDRDQIVALLKRIEQNQEKALQVQEQQLGFAKAQLEKSEKTVKESMDLQRVSLARQAQIRNVAFPLIFVLLALICYVVFKWRVLL
jgi:hypothetical protein